MLDAGVITIVATVHENGAAGPAPSTWVSTRATRRPRSTLIGESSIAWVDAGATATASVNWILSQGNGLTPIYVVADPELAIPDNNRANNKASAIYQAPVSTVDLSVAASGISFNPPVVLPGLPFVVSATISNLFRDRPVQRPGRILPWDEFYARTRMPLAAHVTLPVVPAMSSATATFAVPAGIANLSPYNSTGNFYVTIYVDPFGLLKDSNLTNNVASTYAIVANDLSLSLSGFGPPRPPTPPVTAGMTAALQATVTSTELALQHIPWTLYVGDPAFGGTAVQSGVVEVSSAATILKVSALTTGPSTLFVLVLDPQNTLGNSTPGSLAQAMPTPAATPTWASTSTT